MATHFSILAWRIPWREEPGELQSTESQRVGRGCATNTLTLCVCVCVCVYIYIYHIFLSQLSVVRHLGCFCVLAIVNTAAMNIGGQASFQTRIFYLFQIYAQEWDFWIIQ